MAEEELANSAEAGGRLVVGWRPVSGRGAEGALWAVRRIISHPNRATLNRQISPMRKACCRVRVEVITGLTVLIYP